MAVVDIVVLDVAILPATQTETAIGVVAEQQVKDLVDDRDE